MTLLIEDRAGAGRELAKALATYRNRDDVLVLAVPPGGVAVAEPIAQALDAPMDLMVACKLRAAGNTVRPLGAIACGGVLVLDWEVVSTGDVSDETIDDATAEAEAELERLTAACRGNRLVPHIQGRTVVLVDDGIVTGATIRVAIMAVRAQRPAKLILAVPVAPFDVLTELSSEVDEVVCVGTPFPFVSVSDCYWWFPELTDADVGHVLAGCWDADDARAAALHGVRSPAARGETARAANDRRNSAKPATAFRHEAPRSTTH